LPLSKATVRHHEEMAATVRHLGNGSGGELGFQLLQKPWVTNCLHSACTDLSGSGNKENRSSNTSRGNEPQPYCEKSIPLRNCCGLATKLRGLAPCRPKDFK
jgi:hypothetical protein